MYLKGIYINFKQLYCLILYYVFARHLPKSHSFLGKVTFSKQIRYLLCKQLFKKIGANVNIEKNAFFGIGTNVEIGNNSGLGVNCRIPNLIRIGDNVMMGPNCYILDRNHKFRDLKKPMIQQGFLLGNQTIIEDDVWIGRDVTMTPGRHISKGSIIGACCLLCRDFPPYSIIGGNPSNLIRSRLD